MSDTSVVRLDELPTAVRRAVLALIEAQAHADGHHVMENGRCKYATAHHYARRPGEEKEKEGRDAKAVQGR